MTRRLLLLAGALLPAAAGAASLSVAKSTQVVSDALGLVRPRMLPGSVVDYLLTVTNPVGNLTTPVTGQAIEDTIPAATALRVADLGAAGSGPVEFVDGGLLGLGLTNSGLSYRFTALASTTDGIDFFDGTSWTYVPVPDASGYDTRVRGIRVRLTGTHATLGSYRLRYRTKIL